jgi:ribosome-associated protein
MEIEKIISELSYKAVRSSGAGGQNVNKVSSKVVLTFDLKNSKALCNAEKVLIETKLISRLTSDLVLILNCDENRSQFRNKEIVTKRFIDLITKTLIIPKERKPTKISKSAIRKRIKIKKIVSEIKKTRKRPEF